MRPIADYFATLPGEPIGIINWNDHAVKRTNKLFNNGTKNKIHALIRGRKFATLEHLCTNHHLLFSDIHKRDIDTLHSTIASWNCDLVITSSCSFVPSEGLPHLKYGAVNMHPSWLPDYRGGEPSLWHILENREYLATSIHRLTDEYDCGAVLAQKRIPRPHAVSKAALSLITDDVLGKQLLIEVIELLSANPNALGVEQPAESPTCYARSRTPEVIADERSIDSFSAQTLWDLLHYFGYCPQQWLALSGWQKQLQWRPARLYIKKKTDEHANWTVNKNGTAVFLHSDQATIELRPKLSSLCRLLR